MRVTASPATLARTYEALRAGALGLPVTGTPRGLAVLRNAGLAAWMAACPPDRPTPVRERPVRLVSVPAGGDALGRELAPILAAMALADRTHLEVAP
jgi:hypothetical protein